MRGPDESGKIVHQFLQSNHIHIAEAGYPLEPPQQNQIDSRHQIKQLQVRVECEQMPVRH